MAAGCLCLGPSQTTAPPYDCVEQPPVFYQGEQSLAFAEPRTSTGPERLALALLCQEGLEG